MTALQVAVIGGGVSGLASAFRIAERGHQVTLFEGEDILGGLGTTFEWRGHHLERFYHCLLPEDRALLSLIRDVGMESDLLWRGTDMGFMYRGKVYPLNTAMDLLTFSPLSILERIRMGWMGIQARKHGLDPALDHIPVDQWIKGLVGERAFNILWKPLLEAKIGDQYPALPALWLSSRMAREKNTKREMKGCLTGGYRSLIDGLAQWLRNHGGTIRMRTRVEALERDGERMAVRLEGGARETFDTVVSTSPLVHFQKMTQGLPIPPGVANLKLDYQGVVCAVFMLRKPLSRYYWMPFVDSGATAQGVIEMSNLVPLERAGGHWVSYMINYCHRTSELFSKSEAEIEAMYRRDLERLFPAVGREVEDVVVFKAPFVEPIWSLGYTDLCPPNSVIPGRLYLSCTAQVYPRVNSWNSCCEVVEGMMPRFFEETAQIATPTARSAS
ncbi:MAG: FAD-dependent oxidoreductase [Candidatus Eisenbacteria bacterium]|uniref:FAD-dependent oxidoreductase n=1 Tax=Eiseniibacteriota bacterium TaxID=2212470 RepID=A0A849SBB2_UNCEI|nr:FAD-dependent oxidoreductase [Candidatus Eisenbacteria bacterium]